MSERHFYSSPLLPLSSFPSSKDATVTCQIIKCNGRANGRREPSCCRNAHEAPAASRHQSENVGERREIRLNLKFLTPRGSFRETISLGSPPFLFRTTTTCSFLINSCQLSTRAPHPCAPEDRDFHSLLALPHYQHASMSVLKTANQALNYCHDHFNS